MTDPNLTQQLEQEAAETAAVLQSTPPQPSPFSTENREGESTETPAAPVKLYYKANRHDRRKAKALARKSRKQSRP